MAKYINRAYTVALVALVCIVFASCGASDSGDDSNYDNNYSWRKDADTAGNVDQTETKDYEDSADKLNISDNSVQRIVERYNVGMMTQTDYKNSLDMMEEYIDAIVDEFRSSVDNADSLEDLQNSFESMDSRINSKYPGMDDVVNILDSAYKDDKMNPENALRYKKLMQGLNIEIISIGEKTMRKFNLDPEDMGEFNMFS